MKKKIRIISIIVILIISLASFIIVSSINNKVFEFKDIYSFSETRSTSFNLNEAEKTNINMFLERAKIEDENFYGFSSFDTVVNLNNANTLTNVINILNDQELKILLKNKLLNISQVEIDKLGFLDILYYSNICEKLNIEYSKESIFNALNKFYDVSSDLFFIFGDNDLINIKIVATNMAIEILPDLVKYGKYNISEGVLKALQTYEFLFPDNGNSFYNSGADIILAYSKIENLSSEFLSDYTLWFEAWERNYKFEIDDLITGLVMADFYSIALIFDPNYDCSNLQNYFNSVDTKTLSDTTDYQLLQNSLKYLNFDSKSTIKSGLSLNIPNLISSLSIFSNEVDIISTYYGVTLSKNTGFKYDLEKVKKYISFVYDQIQYMKDRYKAVDYLYYNIILEQQINNYRNQYSIDAVQNFINSTLKEFSYSDNMVYDLHYTRKIIEIIADSNIHGNNLVITNSQRNKVSRAVKKYVNTNEVHNSSFIIDLFYICDLLDFDFIEAVDVYKSDNILTLEKGNINRKEDGLPPDVLTTFNYYACYMSLPTNEIIYTKKEFVRSLKIDDGIYLPYKEAQLYDINLKTILYSNAIVLGNYGGEK